MRWFRPILAPDPSIVGDRFGGAPRAVGGSGWPVCGECGGALTLVAQLAHDDVRLALGAADRVLSIWWCTNAATACDTWDPDAGATLVAVHGSSTPCPDPPPGTHLLPDAAVAGWIEGDDGIAPEALERFFSVQGFRALTDADAAAATAGTHLGGAPRWAHSPDESLLPPYHFVLQLDPQDIWPDGAGPDLHGGTAYVFLDRTVDPPAGALLWQS